MVARISLGIPPEWAEMWTSMPPTPFNSGYFLSISLVENISYIFIKGKNIPFIEDIVIN